MISVPESLKTEIEKLRGRKLEARCRFDFSDTSIDNTIIGYGSSYGAGSYPQIYNGKKDVSQKWFSLDGSSILDGTYYIMPETETELERFEVGWWSEELSNYVGDYNCESPYALGDFAFGDQAYSEGSCYPSISVNFLARQVSELSIAFDNARKEWGVDFEIRLYDINNALLYSETITGNTGVWFTKTIPVINNVCVVQYVIKKWSDPLRNAKVAEMFTMISLTVNGRDIKHIQVVEDRELSDDGLPLGTTSSSSCVITLFNRNRLFDWDNTTSRLYNYVRKGIKIFPEIGDGINWVPLGVFFAEEWDIPKKDIMLTVSGLDRMALLDDSEYATSKLIEAPDDQTFAIDTEGEWESGYFIDTRFSSGAIRMVF